MYNWYGDTPLDDQIHNGSIQQAISARAEWDWRGIKEVQKVLLLLVSVREVKLLVIYSIKVDCNLRNQFVLEC